MLAGALEPSLGRRLQEALSEAALELSSQLDEGRIELRVAGGDPELVYVSSEEATAAPADASSEESLSARVTLRLPDSLKSRIEDAAATGGVSLNTWIVRTLSRAVELPVRPNSRHRLTEDYGGLQPEETQMSRRRPFRDTQSRPPRGQARGRRCHRVSFDVDGGGSRP